MSGYLLDTNVLSEFNRRGAPDERVRKWLEAADPASLYVSVLTLGEIRFGIELLPPSSRRTQLEAWLDQDLPEWFENRILKTDQAIANRWALLRAQARKIGRPLSVVDALLAATALQHNLAIASRNVSDLSVVAELEVLNPWGFVLMQPADEKTIAFVRELVDRFPRLSALLEEHIKDNTKDNTEILPHVFFGDVTRYAASLGIAVRGGGWLAPREREELTRLLQFLEESYSDQDLQELISVSFLENLVTRDPGETQVSAMLGPELSRQMRVIEGEES